MMAEHNWGKWEPLCISLQIYVRTHWSKSQHHLLIFQPRILCRLRVVRCEMWDVTVSVVSVVTVALHWRHWTLWAVRTLPCFLYWENRGSQPAHTTPRHRSQESLRATLIGPYPVCRPWCWVSTEREWDDHLTGGDTMVRLLSLRHSEPGQWARVGRQARAAGRAHWWTMRGQ